MISFPQLNDIKVLIKIVNGYYSLPEQLIEKNNKSIDKSDIFNDLESKH